ncbi:LLM class oxidoreductase [Flindersiella endophytica]
MPKLDIGPIGAGLNPGDDVREVEELGFSTAWFSGGPLQDLGQLGDAVRSTERITIGSGIIAVDRFGADAVKSFYAEIEESHPGRFIAGLGGAHGAKPLQTLNAYLDELDGSIPVERRALAALGPRMLELARDRTAGAYPFLVTPEYVAQARAQVGDDTSLVIGLFVIPETDPVKAREVAGPSLSFLSQAGPYRSNFKRHGFTEDDIDQVTDRFFDAIVAWGDPERIAARVQEYLSAGADQVALSLRDASTDVRRALAKLLIG